MAEFDSGTQVCVYCNEPLSKPNFKVLQLRDPGAVFDENKKPEYFVEVFDPEDVRFRLPTNSSKARLLQKIQPVLCKYDGWTQRPDLTLAVSHKECHDDFRDECTVRQRNRIRMLPHNFAFEEFEAAGALTVQWYETKLKESLREDYRLQQKVRQIGLKNTGPDVAAITSQLSTRWDITDDEQKMLYPFEFGQKSAYLVMLQETYTSVFCTLDVVVNQPWTTPSPKVIQEHRLDKSGWRVENSIPPSFYLSLGFHANALEGPVPTDIQPHSTWDLKCFLNRLLVFDIKSHDRSFSAESLKKFMTGVITQSENPHHFIKFWIIESATAVYDDPKNTKSFQLVILQLDNDEARVVARPTSLFEMATTWVGKALTELNFPAEVQALDKEIRAHYDQSVSFQLSDIIPFSRCVYNTTDNKMRIYFNCSVNDVAYGFSLPTFGLYRHVPKSPYTYPIPVVVDTQPWSVSDETNWKCIRDYWGIQPNADVDRAVADPCPTSLLYAGQRKN